MINNLVIIGYGSAGKKFAKIVKKNFKNVEIFIVTHQKKIGFNTLSSLEQIIKVNPKYVIISSPTTLHFKHLNFINNNFKNIKILVEKPLFHKIQKIKKIKNKIYVGYNLRNLKIIKFIKSVILKNKKIISDVSFVNHSFLPSWRENINYSKSSSAKKKFGGGVILDCSHELDLATWLFGDIDILFVDKSKKSNLNIDTEDNCKIFGMKKKISFSFDFNYYSIQKRRELVLLGTNFKLVADLVSGKLFIFRNKIKKYKKFNKNDIKKSYLLEMKNLLSNKEKNLPSYASALKTQQMIQKIQKFKNEKN
tara:strand:- start:5448 stop:6371 length:924 start_codon:yes stop_codon:yes gene_type:complete